jgi:hypothetical protein
LTDVGNECNKGAEVIVTLLISVFHGKPILEFLHVEEARSIVHDEDIPRPERAARFRRLIRSWKFPELVNSELEFQEWHRGLPQSEGIVVHPAPGFESRECTVEIRTKSQRSREDNKLTER